MIKKAHLHFHGLLMWTNDAQINYKMSASYGVNLLILAKAIKINIFTQKWACEDPQRSVSQLHRKV